MQLFAQAVKSPALRLLGGMLGFIGMFFLVAATGPGGGPSSGGGATNGIQIQGGAGNNNTFTNPTSRLTHSVAGHLTVSSNATVTGTLTATGSATNNSDLYVRRSITVTGTNANGSLAINSYSNTSPSILIQRYNDIEAAPTAVQTGDFLGRIEWLGYGASNLREAFDMRAEAIANFSGTEASTRLNWRVGNNSASARLAYSWDNYNATQRVNVIIESNLIVSGTATAANFSGAASNVTFDASNFSGNLLTTDNTLQELAAALDALPTGGGGSADGALYTVQVSDGAGNLIGTNQALREISANLASPKLRVKGPTVAGVEVEDSLTPETNTLGRASVGTSGGTFSIFSGGLARMTFNGTSGEATVSEALTANGKVTLNRDVIMPWRSGVNTNIYATNGPNQIYNLVVNTNLGFVPFSGVASDASNSVPVVVQFTQDSTGGRYVTNNGRTIFVNTNPLAVTYVPFSVVNNQTNLTQPFGYSPTNPAANHTLVYDPALGGYRNQTAAGGGDALVANPLSQFAATTSAELFGVISDETGSGAGALAMFNIGPYLHNGSTGPGYIDFREDTDNGANRVRIIGPSSTADVTLTLQATTGDIYSSGGTDVAVADGGTGLSSGTSGGILAYTASGTLASSAALAAREIVVGGGAGVVPLTAGVTIPLSGVLSNVTQIKFKAAASPAITTSNLVLNFNTNRYFLTGLTNAIFTNLVEESTSALDTSDTTVFIKNTTGVTMGLVWPAYGAQHGYFLRTNANNPIISTTTLASGALGVATFTAWPDGTNISATFTTWP